MKIDAVMKYNGLQWNAAECSGADQKAGAARCTRHLLTCRLGLGLNLGRGLVTVLGLVGLAVGIGQGTFVSQV